MQTQCGKTWNSLSTKIISWNELYSNFFRKKIAFTKFLAKKCDLRVNFSNFQTVPQCADLGIFLQFRFYVKSIFDNFRVSKTANLTPLLALNLDYWQISALKYCKISLKSLFRTSRFGKMVVFVLQESLNWFHVKSVWQKNSDISTLCRKGWKAFLLFVK